MNIVCDICHQRTRQAPDGSQPICSPCLRSQRIASGIPVEPLPACPDDLLPFLASVEFGPVPKYPTSADFHLAVTDKVHSTGDKRRAAEWRLERIRARP